VRSVGEPVTSPLPSPTAIVGAATPIPSPTTSAVEVDVSKLQVSILNGSGKIGEAGKVEKLIEGAGFVVKNTGNALTFDFVETLIQVKNSVSEEVISKLKEVLLTSYAVKVGSNLPSTSKYDIVVTVGSKGR
jgi:pyridoxal biosynthesis lyase PdxS